MITGVSGSDSSVGELAYEYARELNDRLTSARNIAVAPPDVLGSSSFDDLIGVVAGANGLARRMLEELAPTRAGAGVVSAPDLANYRIRARELDQVVGGALDRARVFDGALDLAHELDGAAECARLLRREIDGVPVASTRSESEPKARTVPSVRRLLMAATRLLPPGERTRYEEEFASELAEIARSGGRYRVQLAYAIRQVTVARQLSTELRAPRRRKATP